MKPGLRLLHEQQLHDDRLLLGIDHAAVHLEPVHQVGGPGTQGSYWYQRPTKVKMVIGSSQREGKYARIFVTLPSEWLTSVPEACPGKNDNLGKYGPC